MGEPKNLQILSVAHPERNKKTLRKPWHGQEGFVNLAFNRNEYHKMFLESRVAPKRKDDNLTAISEPIV
jgi:hypothetical protein